MRNKYEHIAIDTNNKAEKVAAIYHLAQLSGVPIEKSIIRQTISGTMVREYPYVRIISNASTCYVGASADVEYEVVVVPFSQIHKVEGMSRPPITLALGQKYKIGVTYVVTIGRLTNQFVLIMQDNSIRVFVGEAELIEWLIKNDAILVK